MRSAVPFCASACDAISADSASPSIPGFSMLFSLVGISTRRTIAPYRRDAEDDERNQHSQLRDGESRLRARRRELVQVGELVERLEYGDEAVEIQGEDDGGGVDAPPWALELSAMDRIQRHGQHDDR